MATLNSRLKEALDIRHMTQADLCEATDIPKSAMSQYVSGKISPKQTRTYFIAKALNVSEAWLMGYDVPMERVPITTEVHLKSMVVDKAEEYISALYLPTDERKKLTREIIEKTETLSVIGMRKVIDRIDELQRLSDENIHEDYREAVKKTIQISHRNYTQSIAAGTGGEGFTEEKINEVNEFARQIEELENKPE